MPPRVLYHCTCRYGVLQPPDSVTDPASARSSNHPQQNAESSTAAASRAVYPPSLPSQSAASRYSFHPLSHLYFCGECTTSRCHLCAQSEIVTHYCPSCLFEVPSASVKSERSRCPRNCFLCPVEGCGSYLSVWATDPRDVTRLESVEASVGRPPYFLLCLQCKWDSKKGMRGRGYVFEKPTGISSQLAAQQGTHPGQLEMDKLRTHFESYIRKQTTATNPSGLATSSSYSSGLSRSKLLRDLPGIENSKYLTGSRKGAAAQALDRTSVKSNGPPNAEVLPAYDSDYAPTSGAVPRGSSTDAKTFQGDEYGIMGKREENNRKWLQNLTGSHSQSISGVEERWRSGWDEGPREDALDPLRVPLKTKVTLRCPACRHILVKPDPKASSYRWKIRLTAINYLPEIATTFKGVKGVGLPTLPGAGGLGAASSRRESAVGRRTSAIGFRDRGSVDHLRRPQSMLFAGGAAGPGAGDPTAVVVDPEKLVSGKTYDYELSFKNPLEDVIAVHLTVVQPSRLHSDAKSAPSPFTILLSTTRFTVKPFDDVDIIDEDLLGDPRSIDEAESRGTHDDHEDAFVANSSSSGASGGASSIQHRSARRKGWEKGVLRKQGNETVIALRLEVPSSEEVDAKSREVEFALLTTITYRLDAASEGAAGGGGAAFAHDRSLDFWTSVRLGKTIPAIK